MAQRPARSRLPGCSRSGTKTKSFRFSGPSYLEVNLGADKLTLSADDVERLNGALVAFSVSGERYGAAAATMWIAESPPTLPATK